MSIYFFSSIIFTQVIVTIQLANNNSSVPQRIQRQAQQDGVEFSYTNAHRWSERFPMCRGLAQSPINLTPFSCQKLGPTQGLTFINAHTPPRAVDLINGDHTVRYLFHWNANRTARITGGPLGTAQYIPHEVHFHWTDGLLDGTEHAVYGIRFTMEMHVVCYNAKYRNLAQAMNFVDGVLVLGQLFQKFLFGESSYHYLQLLPYIRRRGAVLTISQSMHFFTLDQFINVNRFNRYIVSYTGSLTTPPCREGILWVINVIPRKISFTTMRLFNRIQGMGGFINNNVRPLQRNNGRTCYSNL